MNQELQNILLKGKRKLAIQRVEDVLKSCYSSIEYRLDVQTKENNVIDVYIQPTVPIDYIKLTCVVETPNPRKGDIHWSGTEFHGFDGSNWIQLSDLVFN